MAVMIRGAVGGIDRKSCWMRAAAERRWLSHEQRPGRISEDVRQTGDGKSKTRLRGAIARRRRVAKPNLDLQQLGDLENVLEQYQKTRVAWLSFLRENGLAGFSRTKWAE